MAKDVRKSLEDLGLSQFIDRLIELSAPAVGQLGGSI